MLVHELPLGVYHSVSCLVKWWKLHSNSGRWGLFQIMFLFNAYCFFLKLYLRVRTCICNFHFPHGDKCIRGIVHIFVIFSAKYEIFHNLQLLQRTLLSNFTKYKNIQNTKKVQNVSQFAASTKDTSKQFYKIQKKYKYSTICSFYNGHFQAILQNTKIYKIQKKIPNVPQFAASTTDTSKRFYKIQKIQVFHNLQLLQWTLPSNFTKYKKVQKIHNLQLLQRTLPSNFT